MLSNKEILTAMQQKLPVMANGIRYAYIQEYVMTIDEKGDQRRSFGLLDQNGNSMVRVLCDAVSLAN